MITLYHLDYENHSEMTPEMSDLAKIFADKSLPQLERDAAHDKFKTLKETACHKLAADLFRKGGYIKVAEIDSNDMEYVFKATQNGVLSDSWSRMPPEYVKPCEPSFHLHKDEKYGRKSTDVGDILEVDGKLFIVASFGFKAI
jgi:hypothetical protein